MRGLSFVQELQVSRSDIGAITGSSKSSFPLVCRSDAKEGSKVDCDCDLDGGAVPCDCALWLGAPYAGDILGNSVIVAPSLVRRTQQTTKRYTMGTCSMLGTYTYQHSLEYAAQVEAQDPGELTPEAYCRQLTNLVNLVVESSRGEVR